MAVADSNHRRNGHRRWPTGFDGHHRRVDGSHPQDGVHAGGDRSGGQAAGDQQDLDQCPGALAVAQMASGLAPVTLVDSGERSARSGPGPSGSNLERPV